MLPAMPDAGSTLSGFTTCPVPLSHRTEITVGHGGGGRLTQDLIDRVFRPAFANPGLEAQHDGAMLGFPGGGSFSFFNRISLPELRCCLMILFGPSRWPMRRL